MRIEKHEKIELNILDQASINITLQILEKIARESEKPKVKEDATNAYRALESFMNATDFMKK